MQQNNGMSRAAAMAYRVLIRRGVSALPVHPLEILSACRNTVVWADVTAAEQLKIPREALLRQLDVLVDGAYMEQQRDLTLSFRGSRNQRLIDVPASLQQGTAVLYQL